MLRGSCGSFLLLQSLSIQQYPFKVRYISSSPKYFVNLRLSRRAEQEPGAEEWISDVRNDNTYYMYIYIIYIYI